MTSLGIRGTESERLGSPLERCRVGFNPFLVRTLSKAIASVLVGLLCDHEHSRSQLSCDADRCVHFLVAVSFYVATVVLGRQVN
jgi:hypothetical protein